jgi:hypothetical protein
LHRERVALTGAAAGLTATRAAAIGGAPTNPSTGAAPAHVSWDRWFESTFLQRGVSCEPDFRGRRSTRSRRSHLTETTARPLAPHPRHRTRPYRKEIAYFSTPHTLTLRRIWVVPSSKTILKSNRQPAASSILVHTELAGAKKSVPRRSMSQSWAPTREM